MYCFRLDFYHVQAVLVVHRFMASYYPPAIFKHFLLTFVLRLLIVIFRLFCQSFDLRMVITFWHVQTFLFSVLRVITSNYPFGNFKIFLFVFRFTASDYLIVIFKFVVCPLSYDCELAFGIFKHFVSVLQFTASNYRFSIFKVICLRFSLIVKMVIFDYIYMRTLYLRCIKLKKKRHFLYILYLYNDKILSSRINIA